MKTIRQIASQFGLSRTALLYYDRRGLLRPDYRTSSGHRFYSEKDEDRLAQICRLREAGIPLNEIDAVLEPNRAFRTPLRKALNRRLTELNREIAALRRQQQVVVSLLRQPGAEKKTRIMSKQDWVKLLTSVGMKTEDCVRWHQEFERLSPEAHQDFLESIGIEAKEIRHIRAWARGDTKPSHPPSWRTDTGEAGASKSAAPAPSIQPATTPKRRTRTPSLARPTANHGHPEALAVAAS